MPSYREFFEVSWSGTLERQGKASGLSAYVGNSSLFIGAKHDQDRLEYGECKRVVTPGRKLPPDERAALEIEVLKLLKRGWSHRGIARVLRCTVVLTKAVARKNGLRRTIRGETIMDAA